MSPYPHLPDSHILDKSFPKKFFCKGVQLYFEISLLSFIHKIFKQNFYLYTTVYLVGIWTYKNADEKAHTFSSRSKNVKKRTKTNEKRILRKFTLSGFGFTKNEQRFFYRDEQALDKLRGGIYFNVIFIFTRKRR